MSDPKSSRKVGCLIQGCALFGVILLGLGIYIAFKVLPVVGELANGLSEASAEFMEDREEDAELQERLLQDFPVDEAEVGRQYSPGGAVEITLPPPDTLPDHVDFLDQWALEIAEYSLDFLGPEEELDGAIVHFSDGAADEVEGPDDLTFRFRWVDEVLTPTLAFPSSLLSRIHYPASLRIEVPLSDDRLGSSSERFALRGLVLDLGDHLGGTGAGFVSASTLGDGRCGIRLEGSSSDQLLELARPLLQRADLPDGSVVIKPGHEGEDEAVWLEAGTSEP